MLRSIAGKYKSIILSIFLFLLLDASVLVVNFYMSFQIAEDAVAVNLAGRQRMLSQRMMKAILDIKASTTSNSIPHDSFDELRQTTTLFNDTLLAFNSGGSTVDASGNAITLAPVATHIGLSAIEETITLWTPYIDNVNYLLNAYTQGQPYDAALTTTINYGKTHNLKLLGLMNALTVDLENKANTKAKRMRLIQSIGITLAIINFFIILFHFIKQLRRSDKIADTARNEREQILNTVNEGLFLLDNHFIIGKQYSQILHKMLGKKEIAGLTFKALLGDIVSEKNLITAKEFIELLFSPRIKENLINDLNPLDKIQINLQDDTGRFITKYIRFSFARVHQQHSIDTILVTVTDITNETLLSAQLDKAKEQSHRQFETLSTLINIEPKQLSLFLGNTNHTFNKINNALKLPSKNQVHYQDKINDILGLMHSVKGESSSLGFHELADKAHQFENELKPLKEKAVMDGNDFLSGVVILEEMMKQVEALKKLASELSSHNIGNNPPASIPARYDWKHLHQLTESTARRQHKTVELYTAGLHEISLPDNLRQAVSSIAIQLVRNAISHGIELPAERLKKGKPLASQLHINLYQNKKGKILLVVQDDGNGINKKQLLARAMETNIINEKQASSMDNKQTLELIFHPDFSIKEDIDIDAGQGIGMESVRRIVQNWKGQIKLKSHIGNGTTFYITLDPSSHHTKKAA